MPGQRLRYFRMDAATGQVADKRVPQSVKVRDTSGVITVADAHGVKIIAEHPRHVGSVGHGEGRRAGQLGCEVRPQVRRQFPPDRQHVLTSPLAMCRRNRHRRRVRVQVE